MLRTARYLSPIVTGALMLVAVLSPLTAQPSGTLVGIVTAADTLRLVRARVEVMGTALTTVTGEDGGFRVPRVPVGQQTIQVRMLGYAPLLLPVAIVADDSLNVRVILVAQPVALQTVEVSAETALLPEMRGFEERKARGSGTFFTRTEITRMHARQLTDVLRRVPGMQIQTGGGSAGTTGSTIQTARNGGLGARPCPMQFFLNGQPFPVSADASINQYVSAADIEAVEVYNGTAQVPARFNSAGFNSRCGVIVIWTRFGPDRGK